ncbi:MAG: gliding motility-associated C-terminal domain-containing protein [Bacteroidales bacterium]|jgi:gliding motility-associated-like protein|nr:gliding motility-associated C-terminal domain-containing protein [Bacteroidales bacterium]
MNKLVYKNLCFSLPMLFAAAILLIINQSANSQGILKAELRSSNCPVADHEADRWYFGQNAALDFRNQDPFADQTNAMLNVPTCPAVVSDSNGTILFYTDGLNVYNRYNSLVANGSGLHGFVNGAQPVLIVPHPGNDSIYFIFPAGRPKMNPLDPTMIYGLEYSAVNVVRNGFSGEVTKKNHVLLGPEVSTKLTAVRHSNGVDYWVVAHKFNSDEFCSFLVSSNGVDTTGYRSSFVGTTHSAPGESNTFIGFMKISPDGTKLASAIHGAKRFEIFDFNASNGAVSNEIVSDPIFDDAYSVEFSPDSRYLYGTATPVNIEPLDPPHSYIYQFDVNDGNQIFDPSFYTVIAQDTLGSYFGGIQLGTDGRIYVSRSPNGYFSLSVIQNPKRDGLACNFMTNALPLAGKRSYYGFPNFMQSYFDLPHFDVENVCFTDTMVFTLQNNSNITNATWQFDDGGPVTLNAVQPTYTFSGPGTYDVRVTEFNGTDSYGPYTETVVVRELPTLDIGDTVYMYPGSPILLDAGDGYVTYEWSNGESVPEVKIYEAGTYTVTVQNELCCFKSDTAEVIYFDVQVPNAFRPGGANPVFKAFASSPDAIVNFKLFIYNRWGQLLYEGNSLDQGWDGKVKGIDAPGDVYVWLVNYDVERSGKMVTIAYKGNVILLR